MYMKENIENETSRPVNSPILVPSVFIIDLTDPISKGGEHLGKAAQHKFRGRSPGERGNKKAGNEKKKYRSKSSPKMDTALRNDLKV